MEFHRQARRQPNVIGTRYSHIRISFRPCQETKVIESKEVCEARYFLILKHFAA